MRAYRRPREAEEEESAFVSMTDMTVGFLFIVMLMMAYFATQFGATDTVPRELYETTLAERDAERERLARQLDEVQAERDEARAERERLAQQLDEVRAELDRLREELSRAEARSAELERDPRNPLEAYLSAASDERRRLLMGLRAELLRLHPGILIEVSPEGDALRFQGEGLFATGSATLRPQALQIVQDLARLLDDGIACMTLADAGAPRPERCAAGAIVEAVQIEGHTDTVGSAQSNLALSTQRANAAFAAMIAAAPALEQRRNLRGQPVPGVAGYGEMRLAVPTADNVNEPANRRIDIRILMQTPATVDEIETIRQRLREGR
jgi:flagellar motor protein MotB